MAGPLLRIGPILLLLANPAMARTDIPAALDAAIAACASLTDATLDEPPSGWVYRGNHPIPAVHGAAPGMVGEWRHEVLDMSIQAAHWPDTGDRTCTLGPDAPAFESQSLDGRASVPVIAVRAALARWRINAHQALRPQEATGWIDGQSLDCTAPGGRSLGHVTSGRHLARYQFWMIHQATGSQTHRACAVP
ncbi:MAG: hypothetical protein AAF366_00325 [Pseudomonadota bacterium]